MEENNLGNSPKYTGRPFAPEVEESVKNEQDNSIAIISYLTSSVGNSFL